MAKRRYRGTVQAEVAALTHQHIIDAALVLSGEEWIDNITLERMAEKAGVTVQTILRHFGSRQGLEIEVAAAAYRSTVREREEVVAGDVDGVVEYLIRHYESVGDRVIRLLAQEDRYPALKDTMDKGRVFHREWVGRVFAPHMRSEQDRERLVPQLTAVCDVYVWKVLRRDMGMTVEAYRVALLSMLNALIQYSQTGE